MLTLPKLQIQVISTMVSLHHGSYGYFSLLINSNKNINFKILNINSNIPSNINFYINNILVDFSKKNYILSTYNTNSVNTLTFFWEWNFNNLDIFNSSNFFINLQILFERI